MTSSNPWTGDPGLRVWVGPSPRSRMEFFKLPFPFKKETQHKAGEGEGVQGHKKVFSANNEGAFFFFLNVAHRQALSLGENLPRMRP